jgi:hypothetical protein
LINTEKDGLFDIEIDQRFGFYVRMTELTPNLLAAR